LRDRTAILTEIAAPLALTALMGFALGGSHGGSGMRFCIADLDHSEQSAAFVGFVERPSLRARVVVEAVDSLPAAERMIEEHQAECAVVIRQGFARALASGSQPPVEILAVRDEQFAMLATRGLLRDFMNRAATPRDRVAPDVVPLSAGVQMRVVDFFAASMTVLFLNFGVLSGVRALQTEVDLRTIVRLIASPAQPYAIVAGKFAALLIIGLAQMGTMIAATSVLFGTRWGNPLPTAALVFTSVLMAIGLTAFLMSLASNADQGNALAAMVIVLLSIVDGQFLLLQGLPNIFETLTRLTPNGQAFFGFIDLSAAGAHGSLLTIAQPLAVTAIVGLSGITLGGLRAGATLQRMRAERRGECTGNFLLAMFAGRAHQARQHACGLAFTVNDYKGVLSTVMELLPLYRFDLCAGRRAEAQSPRTSCPNRARCTKSKLEPRVIGLQVQEHHETLWAARKRQKTEKFRSQYAARAGIEGTHEQAIRRCGLRRCRYIGPAKTRLQHLLTATAINLVRLNDWWTAMPHAKNPGFSLRSPGTSGLTEFATGLNSWGYPKK
jgi:ABC-type Na+ efflux pump permease subunit